MCGWPAARRERAWEISSCLYVSAETVEFHLGRIFAKLGIRSRQDLITRIE